MRELTASYRRYTSACTRGIRMNKLHLGANALTLFRDLKSAESSPWQSLVPRELFLPVTRSLSRYCLDSDT